MATRLSFPHSFKKGPKLCRKIVAHNNNSNNNGDDRKKMANNNEISNCKIGHFSFLVTLNFVFFLFFLLVGDWVVGLGLGLGSGHARGPFSAPAAV